MWCHGSNPFACEYPKEDNHKYQVALKWQHAVTAGSKQARSQVHHLDSNDLHESMNSVVHEGSKIEDCSNVDPSDHPTIGE